MHCRRTRCTILLAAAALALLSGGSAEARRRTVLRPREGRYRMATRGIWTQFERRGWPSQYWTGDEIRTFYDFDSVVGSTVGAEIDRQLGVMQEMGVNAITIELRTTGTGPESYPTCDQTRPLGFLWPDPLPGEINNLKPLFDLVQSHGMRIMLGLTNTHMEQPFEMSERWLGSILRAVGSHPALDLILFNGDTHVVDSNGDGAADSCGIPAEPPLWLGPRSVPAQHIESAIRYALSIGIPARKLSAEGVVGYRPFDTREGAGPGATDRHLWPTVEVLKRIFDDLGLPDSQRTYAISMYEHPKCNGTTSFSPPCVEEDPDTWAWETMGNVFAITGVGNGARVVAPEYGNSQQPVTPGWKTEWAVESLANVFESYGVEGGSFWIWVQGATADEANSSFADAVKHRGVGFFYYPVQKEILDVGGFHLTAIPNGSFEDGTTAPSQWIVTGDGTAVRYDLTTEAGQPEVKSRGRYALRLTTGSSSTATIEAVSAPIVAGPQTTYTTTLNLRFGWKGGSTGSPATRPNIYMALRYYDATGSAIASRPEDIFRYFVEDKTDGFDTFPLRYTTPAGTSSVRIAIGAARNGLGSPIVLDADNGR